MFRNILIAIFFVLVSNGFAIDREGFAISGDCKLFYRTMGKGKPLIVIHGGPGLTQDYLLPHMERLANNYFVIFYDQRGCGNSTGEINENPIATLVNDLDNLRKTFGFERVSILGHSWGGRLAMEYATCFPESIDKLILSNPSPSSSDDYLLFKQELAERIGPFQSDFSANRSEQGGSQGTEDFDERFLRLLFRVYCHVPEYADRLNLSMTDSASVKGGRCYEAIRSKVLNHHFNLSESLKNLNLPVLIVHGDSDPIPWETAQRTANCIKGAQFIVLENCGHFPFVECPDVYFDALHDFLDRYTLRQ